MPQMANLWAFSRWAAAHAGRGEKPRFAMR